MADTTVRGLSFCTGVGGLELAIHLLTNDYRTVAYVERDAYAQAALLARMEDKTLDPAPIWDDVSTFDAEPWRGAVDLVLAGYPCQPFSIAGKGLGEADPRHLWPHIKRHIGTLLPWLVILENVPRHLGLGFDSVLADLRGMGYRVEAGLFSAAEVGAPHRRNRLFVVGVLGDSQGRDRRLSVGSGAEADHESSGAGATLGDSAGARREEPSSPGISGRARRVSRSRGRRDKLADTEGARLEGREQPAALEGGRPGETDTGAVHGAVADSNGLGRGEQHTGQSDGQPGRDSEADPLHAGEGMADSHGEGQHQLLGCEPSREPDTERRDEELAKPEIGGLGVMWESPPCERLSDGSDLELGDTEGERLPVGLAWRGSGEGQVESSSVPHFPPRPDDHDCWAHLLARVPKVEPALCGMANELAFRHDRLRLTGNGVHPVAAAVAIFSLWTKLVNTNG